MEMTPKKLEEAKRASLSYNEDNDYDAMMVLVEAAEYLIRDYELLLAAATTAVIVLKGSCQNCSDQGERGCYVAYTERSTPCLRAALRACGLVEE